ncbi:MAG TPA: hypothetical protein VEL76_32360 [Gemmataceae bacterium]|nr:hypothetical protein [Gemmataceae bacterium]
MATFNVLKNFHPMIGCDWHDLMPPGSPSITGKAPYLAVAPLVWLTYNLTAKWGPSTHTHWGWTMQRQTDIGPLIPHIGAPNVLLPLIIAFSGSKSYFGTSRILAEGKPVAIAIAKIINTNLNCDGPTKMPPLPTGFVLAFTTHETSVTLGDVLADLAQMVFDSLLQFGIARFFNLPIFGKICTPIYEKLLFAPIFNKLLPALGNGAIMNYLYKKGLVEFLAKGVAIQLPLHIAGILLGSPLGWSPSWSPVGSGGYATNPNDPDSPSREESVHDALRDYINGTGNQHPSSPPPSPTPPPPAADAGAPPPPPPADAGAPPSPPPADAGAPAPPPSADAGAPASPPAPASGSGAPASPPPADAGAPAPSPPADAGAPPAPADAGAPKPPDAGTPAPKQAAAPKPKGAGIPKKPGAGKPPQGGGAPQR